MAIKISLSVWNSWSKPEQDFFLWRLSVKKYFEGINHYRSAFSAARKQFKENYSFEIHKGDILINKNGAIFYYSYDRNGYFPRPFEHLSLAQGRKEL